MMSEEEKVMKLIDKVMSLEEKVGKMAKLNTEIGKNITEAIEKLNSELFETGKHVVLLQRRVFELEEELGLNEPDKSKSSS
jgi:predicted RNase H-like nuclease (RuvC/YqgF family)